MKKDRPRLVIIRNGVAFSNTKYHQKDRFDVLREEIKKTIISKKEYYVVNWGLELTISADEINEYKQRGCEIHIRIKH